MAKNSIYILFVFFILILGCKSNNSVPIYFSYTNLNKKESTKDIENGWKLININFLLERQINYDQSLELYSNFIQLYAQSGNEEKLLFLSEFYDCIKLTIYDNHKKEYVDNNIAHQLKRNIIELVLIIESEYYYKKRQFYLSGKEYIKNDCILMLRNKAGKVVKKIKLPESFIINSNTKKDEKSLFENLVLHSKMSSFEVKNFIIKDISEKQQRRRENIEINNIDFEIPIKIILTAAHPFDVHSPSKK